MHRLFSLYRKSKAFLYSFKFCYIFSICTFHYSFDLIKKKKHSLFFSKKINIYNALLCILNPKLATKYFAIRIIEFIYNHYLLITYKKPFVKYNGVFFFAKKFVSKIKSFYGPTRGIYNSNKRRKNLHNSRMRIPENICQLSVFPPANAIHIVNIFVSFQLLYSISFCLPFRGCIRKAMF